MLSSPQLTSEAVDLDELRARLRKMSEADLIAFGKAARYMCSPKANLGKPPRQPFVIQLQEARAEWRRRKDIVSKSSKFVAVGEGAIESEPPSSTGEFKSVNTAPPI